MVERPAVAANLPPITHFTFVLEMGRRLPAPARQILTYGGRTAAWDGWTPHMLSQLCSLEDPPTFTEELVPDLRMTFREVSRQVATPLYASEIAFGDWLTPVLSDAMRERRETWLADPGSTIDVLQSVVALTRWIPESEHPASQAMTIGWLTDLFRESLSSLNHLLDHMSFAAQDWALWPVEYRDLPAFALVLLESTHLDDEGRGRGSVLTIPIHSDLPHPAPDPGGEAGTDPHDVDETAASIALSIMADANHGIQPFEPVFRFFRAASSEMIGGDMTRGVVELATAMELLFSTLISAGGAAAKWSDERVNRANRDETGLRNRVEYHLGDLLGANVSVLDESSPWGRWWATGYSLRNGAVHRGERVSVDDGRGAWDAAVALVAHIVVVLNLQADLMGVADALATMSLAPSGWPWLDFPLPEEIDWF